MAVKVKDKVALKTYKDLLVLENEAFHSIVPNPFQPSALSVILSTISPSLYSQDQLAQIKSFCEQGGVDASILAQEARINSTRRATKKPRKKTVKRVAAASKKISKPKKKKNAAPPSASSSNAAPQGLPMKFKNKIMELNGTDLALIIHKKLYTTDLAGNNSRLQMSVLQLECDFLTEAEKAALDARDEDNKLIGLEVMVLDPCLREWTTLKLKKWRMKTRFYYSLSADWNSLYRSNDFHVGDQLDVWTFKVQGKRWFLLHKLTS